MLSVLNAIKTEGYFEGAVNINSERSIKGRTNIQYKMIEKIQKEIARNLIFLFVNNKTISNKKETQR